MSEINRIPRGLLSILDQQVQGNYPSNLMEEVRPTMDILDLYFQGRGTELASSIAVTITPGIFNSIGPPAGEMWAIHLASLLLGPGDALATTWFPAIYLQKNGQSFPVEVTNVGIVTGAVLNNGSVCWKPSRPYYLVGPNDKVEGAIERFTGAGPVVGVAMNFRVVFSRISI